MNIEVAVCKPEVRVGRSWNIASMCPVVHKYFSS